MLVLYPFNKGIKQHKEREFFLNKEGFFQTLDRDRLFS